MITNTIIVQKKFKQIQLKISMAIPINALFKSTLYSLIKYNKPKTHKSRINKIITPSNVYRNILESLSKTC
jgi:hypothetical protein